MDEEAERYNKDASCAGFGFKVTPGAKRAIIDRIVNERFSRLSFQLTLKAG